ncbi:MULTISPECIES: GNAT family N-acetyltransferase [Niastella]|uniref:GNAT family N-acetyltransferase n=1 Tax=Niastella soli TaxID=2821487 RepID=A0ABS3YVP3_9BACT|nr:GNAT family N-acetyltransferase [Niastella soli]MBO9202004.1 GNAT family N-acetyltransferase [Niastella soli]
MHHSDPFSTLDNPAWWALTSMQQQFATGPQNAKRYQRGVLPFAALETATTENLLTLHTLFEPGELFYLIGELPPLPPGVQLLKELPCVQMVLQEATALPAGTEPITPLNASHSDDMLHLINKVQPGYYEKDTRRLGNYAGIWQGNELVAIAGERMRLDHLTEISAICTDPAYTGRKYAQYLIAHLCNANLQMGNTPFLHVLETNERAIRLYEYLGFTTRRTISFWQLVSSL